MVVIGGWLVDLGDGDRWSGRGSQWWGRVGWWILVMVTGGQVGDLSGGNVLGGGPWWGRVGGVGLTVRAMTWGEGGGGGLSDLVALTDGNPPCRLPPRPPPGPLRLHRQHPHAGRPHHPHGLQGRAEAGGEAPHPGGGAALPPHPRAARGPHHRVRGQVPRPHPPLLQDPPGADPAHLAPPPAPRPPPPPTPACGVAVGGLGVGVGPLGDQRCHQWWGLGAPPSSAWGSGGGGGMFPGRCHRELGVTGWSSPPPRPLPPATSPSRGSGGVRLRCVRSSRGHRVAPPAHAMVGVWRWPCPPPSGGVRVAHPTRGVWES